VGPPGVGLGAGVAAATADWPVELEDGVGVDVRGATCEPAPHPAITIAVPARRVSRTVRCPNGRGA
ncbi:MAG: hypothetical protein WB802_15140, partial [Candidatus Dormiibacterota bacterium]